MIPNQYLFRWMLHKIDPSPNPDYSYYALLETAFRDMTHKIETMHPGRILYTFDDGYSSDVEISLPLLEEVGAASRGCFFITTSWIGKEGYMTETQVRQLASRPVRIGTHGHTHGFFASMSDKELAKELSVSKQILEGITGKPVESLSVPGGKFDHRLARLASAVGYKKIFTSYRWDGEIDGIQFIGRYCINRINLNNLPRIYSHPVFYRYFFVWEYVRQYFFEDEHFRNNFIRTCLGEKIYYLLSLMIGKKQMSGIK